MTRLAQVSESGQKVAEAIATVLKVDVEIIDTDLVRVAGTGIIRYDVGTRLLRGFVNKHVLQTGNHIFIREAGFHEICLSCPLTGQCFYKASIVYPITAGSETIGTISLIAFNEEQKETLGTNSDSLIEFIGRMADLISSKALESEILTERMVMSNHLEAVVDSVDECVIAVNSEGFITHFNRSAERVFGTRKKQILGKDSKQILPTLPFWEVLQEGKGCNSREVFIAYEGRKLHLLSTLKPIKLDSGQVVGVVGTFRDFKETQKLAYEIMSNQEMIVFEDIVGISRPMLEIKAKAQKVAASNSTVLIVGESGTGKEIFARAIHAAGPHGHRPFISINCAAMPENLLEIELFGYNEGAFSGARRGGKQGKFELGAGGTIFLEEIGNMSLYLQTKLLKVLKEKGIERVGGTRVIPVDVRVIATTNTDLRELVRKNIFRDDLYYQLSVIPLVIPPLRVRQEDIPILLDFYMKRFSKLLGKEIKGFDDEALNSCIKYYWPGNVRELVYAVEYAINLEENDLITMESLPQALRESVKKGTSAGITGDGKLMPLAQLEKEAIITALDQFGWTDEGKTRAARVLGISRATIYRKIQRYDLAPA